MDKNNVNKQVKDDNEKTTKNRKIIKLSDVCIKELKKVEKELSDAKRPSACIIIFVCIFVLLFIVVFLLSVNNDPVFSVYGGLFLVICSFFATREYISKIKGKKEMIILLKSKQIEVCESQIKNKNSRCVDEENNIYEYFIVFDNFGRQKIEEEVFADVDEGDQFYIIKYKNKSDVIAFYDKNKYSIVNDLS